jgi:hypothetical protein
MKIATSFDIKTEDVRTVRTIPEGGLYITLRDWRRHKETRMVNAWIRRRTDDPFSSKTLLGTTVLSMPSDKVYAVEVLESLSDVRQS